jgi:tropomyosin
VLLEKDQEILSLTHKLTTVDGELEKAEEKLNELKTARADEESSKTANEGLVRKIQLLEEELDTAEKNVKETVDKCVSIR